MDYFYIWMCFSKSAMYILYIYFDIFQICATICHRKDVAFLIFIVNAIPNG